MSYPTYRERLIASGAIVEDALTKNTWVDLPTLRIGAMVDGVNDFWSFQEWFEQWPDVDQMIQERKLLS